MRLRPYSCCSDLFLGRLWPTANGFSCERCSRLNKLQLASWRLNRIKKLFVTDDDGLDQRFSIGGQRSSHGQYFIYSSHRVKLENFFDDLLFYFISTSLKITLIIFLKSPMNSSSVFIRCSPLNRDGQIHPVPSALRLSTCLDSKHPSSNQSFLSPPPLASSRFFRSSSFSFATHFKIYSKLQNTIVIHPQHMSIPSNSNRCC